MAQSLPTALTLGATALLLVACGQAVKPPQSAGQEQVTPGATKIDATFIDTATTQGLAELALARLATTAAADAATRDFAGKIAADHTTVDQQLAALAQDQGMTPPTTMDASHQTQFQQLQSLHGAAFDHTYMRGQLQDITITIQTYQHEADSGAIPQVRSFASQYLPMMQQHLQRALAVPAAGP